MLKPKASSPDLVMADDAILPGVSADDLYAALNKDLQQLSERYREVLAESYIGAAVCLSDYRLGTLAATSQDETQPLDAALAMAISLLDTSLADNPCAQVGALLIRARRLVRTAIDLKTGQALATNSLH